VDAALYEIVDFLDVDVLPSDVLDVGSFGLNNLFESVPNVVSLENSDVDYPGVGSGIRPLRMQR
jgi:hypothetical protein